MATPIASTPSNSMLCIVAHPDDETILTGGTLALLASRGVDVHVACLTRGEGGEVGEPPVATRATLGEVREAEMVCAVRALGARSLTFLGYVDPEVGPDQELAAPAHDPVMLAGQLVNAIKQFQPAVVLTHGRDGEYGHPAHKLLHLTTVAAVQSLAPEAPALWTMGAFFPGHPYPRLANASDLADIVVNVAAWIERKTQAAHCHRSQNALFVRRRSEAAGRAMTVREVMLDQEAFHRYHPASADDRFLGWLGAGHAGP